MEAALGREIVVTTGGHSRTARALGVIALVAACVVAARNLLRRYEVAGLSMTPALRPGDWLVCESASARLGWLRRGDVVVFESPVAPGLETIKRVSALVGDVVSLGPGFRLTVDTAEGEQIRVAGNGSNLEPPRRIVVGEGEVFVTGDNLAGSTDSRDFGPLPISSVRAVARWRYGRVRDRSRSPATGRRPAGESVLPVSG